jgi:hypothetical protein
MKTFLKGLSFSLVSCLFFFLAQGGRAFCGVPEDSIVAVVGDYAITEDDIRKYIAREQSIQNANISPEKALDELVGGSILYQEAKRRKIHEKKEIRERIDAFIRNTLIGQLLFENVKQKEVITEAIAKELYEQNWMDSHYPRAADLSCVFVGYQDAAYAKEAEKYAGLIRKQMADTRYEDTKEFLKGVQEKFPVPEGLKLTLKDIKDMLLLSFAKYQSLELRAATSTKEGEVTEPRLVNQSGRQLYAVFKKTKETPRFDAPFKKVSSELMNTAAELRYKEEVNKFIGGLKQHYSIVYKKDVKGISLQ